MLANHSIFCGHRRQALKFGGGQRPWGGCEGDFCSGVGFAHGKVQVLIKTLINTWLKRKENGMTYGE
jgi:hypothetical protein